MKDIKTSWENIIKSSNGLISVYHKGDKELQNSVKDFVENLVNLSESFANDKESTLLFLKGNYPELFLLATSIISNADSVAVIMQANEGINDYLILINLFRNLIVTLNTLSSTYWIKLSDRVIKDDNDETSLIKYLINRSNRSYFGIEGQELSEFQLDARRYKITEDEYFDKVMNKEMWNDIKLLEEQVLSKTEANFEYFKELMTSTSHLVDDMVINLWCVLAITFSYLDYINNLLK